MFKFNKIALAAAVLAIGASAASVSFAREAGEVRGEGAGHPAIETRGDVVAREAGEARGEGAGHPAIETRGDIVA